MIGQPTSIRAIRDELLLARGVNDLVYDAQGNEYVDLFTGNGALLLGHVNPAVRDALKRQLDEIWIAGALKSPGYGAACAAVESYFPANYRLAALYSTGMEAVEFALRVARVVTGRPGVVGFEGCMHGKSTATAYLGWPNDLVELPDFQRMPYPADGTESSALDRLGAVLGAGSVGAVVVEPLQGSRGGHLPSRGFFHELAALCLRHGSLLVVDEIFTGFHRTGEAFLFQELGLSPDVVLVGKVMGSGFPVSGAVVDSRHAIVDAMLPSSTFSGNPLACAAVAATLSELRAVDARARVAAIEDVVRAELAPLEAAGIPVRGKGALWVLTLPPAAVDGVVSRIVRGGVLVSPTASYVRLLPAATISPERLAKACRVVREACLDAV
jgi:acetylornithine/LysW-gamma-L-lysine aminotransferase